MTNTTDSVSTKSSTTSTDAASQINQGSTATPATTNQNSVAAKPKFNYIRLSSTMMKLWLQCKRQFYMKYVEKKTQPPNTSFTLGNAVHYSLEQSNLALKTRVNPFDGDEIEEYIHLFREHLAGVIENRGTFVDDMELFTSGEDMVRNELFSLDYTEKVLEAEQSFDIVTPEGVRIYGFIDKVVEVDPQTVKIVDYKTSRTPLSYEEANKDVQLSMYELAAAVLYPQYKNRVVELNYLRLGKKISTRRSATAQLNFRKQLLAVDKAIKQYCQDLSANNYEDDPKGNVNKLCNWCSFKSDCKEYKTDLVKIGSAYGLPDTINDSVFMEEYKKINTTIKELQSLKDDLKLWAMRRIELDPDTPISNGNEVVSTMSTTRRSYEVGDIAKLLSYDNFQEVVTINNSKMTKFLAKLHDDKLLSKIEQSVTVKFNNPQIRFKKV